MPTEHQSSEAGPLLRVSRAWDDPDFKDPALYLNREIGWLRFNQRVLHEALDDRTPLLERVRFLSIFTSNLDEFFMKRVGGLKRQLATGTVSLSLDGQTAEDQLTVIRLFVQEMLADQARCYQAVIKPALESNGVHLLTWDQLTPHEKDLATTYFDDNVFPILTPLAVDSGHPFPFLSNLSLSLGVVLRHPGHGKRLFTRVKIPEMLPRWMELKGNSVEPGIHRFVSLVDLIRQNIQKLFPSMSILGEMTFRVTRNADVDRDEEDAEDLLEMMEEELRARRFAGIVRLEHGPDPDPWIREFLMEELEVLEQDVYEVPGPLDYTDLGVVADLPLADLKYEPWTPMTPPALAEEGEEIFSLIRSGDLLVHHPFESFNASVERFIQAAADDPRVLAIKMTLYRTGRDSPFVDMLIKAAESGKQVVCLVELKARFDEQRNIDCAQALEKAGVHVVYGIVGLKTHTKTALVVRQEADGMRSYGHIGTGNYHAVTARLYTDLGLLTAKPEFTADLVDLFHYLTGRSLKQDYRKLLVAPVNMKKRFLDMIDREIEHQRAGRPARIIAKMNSLEDRRIINRLYQASEAGVQIDLIVRGFCCLKAGVPGLSENIRVMSVIGRFLEHSRVFYFRHGAQDPADGAFYIGSADWMYRNLNRRVEAITPIEEPALRKRCWKLLQTLLEDQRQAWDMQPDGTYQQRRPTDPEAQIGTHRVLMYLMRSRIDPSAPPSRDDTAESGDRRFAV